MQPLDRNARIAGLLYLLLGLPSVFSLMYVPSKLIVAGNATVTASNILTHETLFRAGMVVELIGSIGFYFVVRALYRLLNGVNKTQASLMEALFAISIPISFLNVLNDLAALALFRGADFLFAIGQPQREALGMLFIRLHGQGINLAAVFWGLWLFPFGLLVIRSGFLPRVLGVLLIINSVAYPASSFTAWLAPTYVHVVDKFATIAEFGELWIMLWLLFMGAKVKPLAAAAGN